MRELRDAPHDPAAPLFSYRARYSHLSRLNYLGLGVIVAGIRDNRIAWGRLYMEPVEADGADIDAMVRDTYRPPEAPTRSTESPMPVAEVRSTSRTCSL